MLDLSCEKWILESDYDTLAIARMFRDITYMLDFDATINIVRNLAEVMNFVKVSRAVA